MDDFDLDIDNYGLEDILNLFHLDYKFEKDCMKKAKVMALKTHPDKSGLGKDFFLFFMKAYKMLEAIYEYRYKKEQCVKKQEYTPEENTENKELLKKLDGKSAKEFNNWFNKMFEEVRVKDEDVDSGYGSWFKSNEDINEEKIEGLGQMQEAIERRKKETKALVKHNGIRELRAGGGYGLSRQKPQEYCSDIFSNLQYEDLKKAHTETVVPVTIEDYEAKPKFDSVEKYVRYREQHRPDMVSLEQSRQMMKDRNMKNDKTNTERAFRLIKRDEEISQSNKKWWSHLKQLEN
uniref:J domain-containing protein n=1 Tax=viral metagenome TaxID=1070528 RepID=A0A6C0JC37_9ZZZZ|tara:strand:+ start:15424 stop:16296 length:873 start_codon:yes stop_codon:yes gene_type:complete